MTPVEARAHETVDVVGRQSGSDDVFECVEALGRQPSSGAHPDEPRAHAHFATLERSLLRKAEALLLGECEGVRADVFPTRVCMDGDGQPVQLLDASQQPPPVAMVCWLRA